MTFARHPTSTSRRLRRRGVGMVELLVALSISAALLTATAVALDASFKAYRANQEIGDLTQRARLAMHRILTEIRSTQDHVPDASVLSIFRTGVAVQTPSIRIYTDATNAIEYRQQGTQVIRQTFTLTGGAWQPAAAAVLLDGVAAGQFNITMEPQRSETAARAGLPCDQLRRATIRMTLVEGGSATSRTEVAGNQSISLVSSVVPRRNAW
jgi:hypothetical protein